MITTTNYGALMGAPVLGPDDEKIGTVGQVFVDPSSGRPNWMTVHTGWFGRSESFVPLDTAEWDHERVHISYGRDFIKDAPRIDTDGALGHDEEDELYRYYGIAREEDGDSGRDDSTGTAHVGAHAADTEPDTEPATDSDSAAPTDSGEQPSRRMRRFVVTEVYVEDDEAQAPGDDR
jgi:hypothetical protein